MTRAREINAWNRVATHPVLLLSVVAILVRIVVFTSRGDYVAFDEGWYLLLGRGLFDGTGYRLSGLQHTTLSPLFPILAGAAGLVLDNAVWAGRIVAALCAGLLIWPLWSIFRRLAGERTAWIGCIMMILMPSLTPFAAPFWIGWDLWVGAEPVMHLMLFGAIALTLRALETGRWIDWVTGGVLFALAYLARPESIVPFALIGGGAGVFTLLRRDPRQIGYVLLMAAAFAFSAAPYWMYLHDTLGRWALTGRYVEVLAPRARTDGEATEAGRTGSAASGIERMLWQNENRQYVRELYGLDATGTRLRSTYWGIPLTRTVTANEHPPQSTRRIEQPEARNEAASEAAPDAPSRWGLYARSLGTIVPFFLWPFALIGLVGARRRPADELLFSLPLLATSIAIARLVGADPRTQLFIVPVVLYYAARGIGLVGHQIEIKLKSVELRPGFVTALVTFLVCVGLAAIVANWVWMGHAIGSRHHAIGRASRTIGAELSRIVPEDEAVMSWHPAVALYAERDWRVLPYASLMDIVHYANAIDCDYIVLSRYYPGSKLFEQIDRDHLVLHVPTDVPAAADRWWIDIRAMEQSHAIGELRYSAPGAGAE